MFIVSVQRTRCDMISFHVVQVDNVCAVIYVDNMPLVLLGQVSEDACMVHMLFSTTDVAVSGVLAGDLTSVIDEVISEINKQHDSTCE